MTQTKRGVAIPTDLANAIRANHDALAGFTSMPPSHQHEYLGAVLEVKKSGTRAKRIRQAVTMMVVWERKRVRLQIERRPG